MDEEGIDDDDTLPLDDDEGHSSWAMMMRCAFISTRTKLETMTTNFHIKFEIDYYMDKENLYQIFFNLRQIFCSKIKYSVPNFNKFTFYSNH